MRHFVGEPSPLDFIRPLLRFGAGIDGVDFKPA
jgi:hypothetical protein